MPNDPTPRPRERRNVDIEQDTLPQDTGPQDTGTQDTGTDERVPRRDSETERTVEPEDEDRRVRPGEKRPDGTMP